MCHRRGRLTSRADPAQRLHHLVRDRCLLRFDTETYKNFKNVNIVSDKSLTFYLQKSDIVISRGSTSVEESLLENIPVLLYDRTNQNKFIDAAQDISNYKFEINNYILYLTQKEFLSNTIKEMLKFDYSTILNNYTYNDKKIFNIIKDEL